MDRTDRRDRLDRARTELALALSRHVAADDLERAHVASIARLVEREPECFARSTFEPGHLTASAFIVDPAGRLLLHHHKKLDRWLQMGGHDEGEHDPFATAAREAREECGLSDLTPVIGDIFDVDVHAIPAGKEPAHLHHDVRFLFVTRTPEAITHDAAESLALAFFPLDEAARLLGDASAARVVAKIRAALRLS